MYKWTWPFETNGPTLTDLIGPKVYNTGKKVRQPNEWDGEKVRPRYPIYVISKGRWDICKTSQRVLERMQIPHFVVVEPQEEQLYAAAFKKNDSKFATILALPSPNFGQGSSIPARNWVWEDAIKTGAKRHWIMDDNLHCFQRLHRGEKQVLWTGAGFCATEDFADRFSNVALAGPEYISFARGPQIKSPYRLNTRIYSCTLIQNNLPYRWRGRYNEDTDLSLRILKDGWCTVLSLAFLVDKTTTMRTKGGNTTELYGGDGRAQVKGDSDTEGRRIMAESLYAQHSDVTQIVRRFGRWHHKVNYKPFAKNALKLLPDAVETVKDYGLKQEKDVEALLQEKLMKRRTSAPCCSEIRLT